MFFYNQAIFSPSPIPYHFVPHQAKLPNLDAWAEEERRYMKRPWTEEELIILKHLVSGAWAEEDDVI